MIYYIFMKINKFYSCDWCKVGVRVENYVDRNKLLTNIPVTWKDKQSNIYNFFLDFDYPVVVDTA